MHQWLNARCAKLLEELNKTPFTDDADNIKLNLIRTAMREASVEMFHRAAESSRKVIEQINDEALNETIHQVEESLTKEVAQEDKQKSSDHSPIEAATKITLQSSSIKPAAAEPEPSESKENTHSESESKSTDDSDSESKPKIQISSSVIRRTD